MDCSSQQPVHFTDETPCQGAALDMTVADMEEALNQVPEAVTTFINRLRSAISAELAVPSGTAPPPPAELPAVKAAFGPGGAPASAPGAAPAPAPAGELLQELAAAPKAL